MIWLLLAWAVGIVTGLLVGRCLVPDRPPAELYDWEAEGDL